MRSITIEKNQSGRKISKALLEIFPRLPAGALYKALRKRDIKANGKRINEDFSVTEGDVLEIYISDEILDGVPKEDGAALNKGFSVAYEDKYILVVSKEQGIPVHPDREQDTGTLVDLVGAYLTGKEEISGTASGPFLCHRLDRNTGGLVILAKDEYSRDILLQKIRNNEIRKYYQCLVEGKMEKPAAELKAYLEKDERKSRVFISDSRKPNSQEIITRYRVLSYNSGISRLEVELVTGRTHQIRAHLAYVGHPLIGDGKYGTNEINRRYKAKWQELWACRIIFDFGSDSGHLNYLKGKKIEIEPEFKLTGGK